MLYDQAEFDIRCEWGAEGVAQLAPLCDVVIIIDVLSFSTVVEIATARGAIVFPFRSSDEAAHVFAESVNAELADARDRDARYTLSSYSLREIVAGTRIVLPSPNGSTLTLATGETPTLAGCLRNARAVANAASHFGRRIAIVPAGERWKEDGTLRPALEDWLGAGAVIQNLEGSLSPEARAALAAYRAMKLHLPTALAECSSGKELIAKGLARDVALAGALNISDNVPVLRNGAYVGVQA